MRAGKVRRGPNKRPPMGYLLRFLGCPSRWYCRAAGRVECDRCGCYLRPVYRVK